MKTSQDSTTNSDFSSRARETILSDGITYFGSLLKDIQHAKSTIDIEFYIFKTDHIGQKFADALIEAAKRGVKIRLMVDGAGSKNWGGPLNRQLDKAKIKVRVFHPFPWELWNWSRSVVKITTLLKWIYLVININKRNHRKVVIIDDKIAYIGSFNIDKCHLNKEEGGSGWRDTAVRLAHTDLRPLIKALDDNWHHRTIKERIREIFKEVKTDPRIRLNYTWHRRRILHKNLLRRISHAKKRVWITNAYFVPDNILLRRLKDAADRGIDVRLLIPRKSDVPMFPWASAIFYSNLLKAGVKIYEYLPGMLHSKILMVDNWFSVGSSNLNSRSILHDLEVDVHITGDHAKQILLQDFQNDQDNSKLITYQQWKRRPIHQRILGRMMLYVKYIL